ncbi:NYN domain-containing protein [Sphingomicrobium clamense]|uniref:NYN domain-containing protein n=1 Tax=Sphingomicrobium clamense TaxID=2851013 RepID=A0ABS6V6H4_9SPHN|nr:NYN domain-containing protein [Sphingomicrobium sp. B8]MBW0145128.1 NYN domain-containing protein [Sphingomicrobium sp. B8]
MSRRNDHDPESLNIALLIDADNASPEHLDEVLLVLGELGTINIRRAYANWRKPALKGWVDRRGDYSIFPVQQFDIVKGKSVTDMLMVIEAMDLLHGGTVDGFGIMSSDSDFQPLVLRIRQEGLPVYGFGTAKAPISFKKACNRFFDVAKLSERGTDGKIEESKIDEELLKVLGDAFRASTRDEEGYTTLSELGQRATQISSFSVRNYGFRSLKDMVRSLPHYDVKANGDSGIRVKRMR